MEHELKLKIIPAPFPKTLRVFYQDILASPEKWGTSWHLHALEKNVEYHLAEKPWRLECDWFRYRAWAELGLSTYVDVGKWHD